MAIKIMQGDACRLPFHIVQDGLVISPEMITDLEVTVGSLRKTYLSGGIEYTDEHWLMNLSQEETMAMSGSEYIRVRIRYKDQPWVVVLGKRAALLNVESHPNAEVL